MQEESCSHLPSSRKLESQPNGPQLEGGLLWKGHHIRRKKWHIKLLRWCKTSSVFLTAQWHLLCFMVAVATQRSFCIWLSGQGQHWMKIRLYVINQVINLIKMDSLCFLFSEAWERERASERHRERVETIERSVYLSTEECHRCQLGLRRKFIDAKRQRDISREMCIFPRSELCGSTSTGVLALLPHPGNLSNPD